MSKVLVILPNNLGDVIMTLPVLEGLKRSDPHTDISFSLRQVLRVAFHFLRGALQ